MIYIYQNEVNNIITRFGDRRKSSTSYFAWEVTNSVSGVIVRFLMEDISPNPCAYNHFQLTRLPSLTGEKPIDDGSEEFENVAVYLEEGHNDYIVYEVEEENFNSEQVLGIVDEDIMFVEIPRYSNSCSDSDFDIDNCVYY